MAYTSIDVPGPSVQVGDTLVTPVARLTELGFVTPNYGAGIQYLRPIRVDVEDSNGRQTSLPITDRTFQVRLAAMAIVALAYIIGRMR